MFTKTKLSALLFKTKRNSSYKRTQHFKQIYEWRKSPFVALISVFSSAFFHLKFKFSKKQSSAQFSALLIILTLFETVALICSNISCLAKATSPLHEKLCKVKTYLYKLDSAR